MTNGTFGECAWDRGQPVWNADSARRSRLNPQEADPVYLRFTDSYLEWAARPQLAVTIESRASRSRQTAPRRPKSCWRSIAATQTNNIWFTEEHFGASVSGTAAPWVYLVGVYSAGAKNKEPGEFARRRRHADLGIRLAEVGEREGSAPDGQLRIRVPMQTTRSRSPISTSSL